MSRAVLLVAAMIVFSGCYHAQVIVSDSEPSNVVLEDAWADGWIYGLVPPAEIDATEKCDTGVATVETKLSFLNQLVGALTFGIYTPMHVTVTCAE